MIIVGIDAGLSTGLAAVEVAGDAPAALIDACQFSEEYLWSRVSGVESFVESNDPDLIVIEQFDLRPTNQFIADLTTVKTNAVFEYLWDASEVTWATPAQHKSIITNDVLKRLDMYPTGKDVGCPDADDARDAIRLCLWYAVKKMNHIPTMKEAFPDE